MASSVNKVILIGHLGRDPEVRYTSSNQCVATFSLATRESWTDKQSQRQQRTEWHCIVVWGKTGELVGKFLSKGRMVYIEGRLQTREWQDKQGNNRTTTEVIGSQVTFLGNRGDATDNAQQPGQPFECELSDERAVTPADTDDVPF